MFDMLLCTQSNGWKGRETQPLKLPSTFFSELSLVRPKSLILKKGKHHVQDDPHGVVAVHGTMPVAQIERLNSDGRVFLADPSASYITLVASQQPEVQVALTEALTERKANIQQQTEPAAPHHDQDAPTPDAAPDADQAITDFIDQHPELQPRVETTVDDLWALINR